MRSILAVLFLLPVLVACDEDPAGPDTSHVGVYELQTVDGAEVPVSYEEEGEIFTVLGVSLALDADGAFLVDFEFEITAEGETIRETDTLAGTYTRSGNTITFTHSGDDAGFETATLSGDVLTTSGGGDEVLVFEK